MDFRYSKCLNGTCRVHSLSVERHHRVRRVPHDQASAVHVIGVALQSQDTTYTLYWPAREHTRVPRTELISGKQFIAWVPNTCLLPIHKQNKTKLFKSVIFVFRFLNCTL